MTEETVRRWETEAEDVPDAIKTVLCVLAKLGCGVFRLMQNDSGTFDLVQSTRVNMNLAQDVDNPRYNLTAAEIEDQGKAPDSFDAETVRWNWDVGAEFRISIKKPGLQGLRP